MSPYTYDDTCLDSNNSLAKSQDLCKLTRRDRMFFAKRACSSKVEQWPFKPLVERSSRSTLIFCLNHRLVERPLRGDEIRAAPRSFFV